MQKDSTAKNHKSLLVWQKSMQLVKEVYYLIKLLPREENTALADQMRRAVVSIPSNIAEGNARDSDKEFLHFLCIAQGSNAEIETQLMICRVLGYFSKEQAAKAMTLNAEVGKMLWVMTRNLRKRITGS